MFNGQNILPGCPENLKRVVQFLKDKQAHGEFVFSDSPEYWAEHENLVDSLDLGIDSDGNKRDELKRAIDSFLDTEMPVRIYVIDNSPTPELENIIQDKRAEYFYLNANRGFGAGHNVILRRPHLMGKYHIILNPDIYFEKGTTEALVEYMDNNQDVGNVMHKSFIRMDLYSIYVSYCLL